MNQSQEEKQQKNKTKVMKRTNIQVKQGHEKDQQNKHNQGHKEKEFTKKSQTSLPQPPSPQSPPLCKP
jgi:hypothetical protein